MDTTPLNILSSTTAAESHIESGALAYGLKAEAPDALRATFADTLAFYLVNAWEGFSRTRPELASSSLRQILAGTDGNSLPLKEILGPWSLNVAPTFCESVCERPSTVRDKPEWGSLALWTFALSLPLPADDPEVIEPGEVGLVSKMRNENQVLAFAAAGMAAEASVGEARTLVESVQPSFQRSASAAIGPTDPLVLGAGVVYHHNGVPIGHGQTDMTLVPGAGLAYHPNGAETAQTVANTTLAVAGLPIPLGQKGWGDALGERVLWQISNRISAAQLNLNPPDLGPLEVRVILDGDKVQVHFASAHGLVREALEHAIPRLREMLSTAGLQLLNAGVYDTWGGAARHAPAESSFVPPLTTEDDETSAFGPTALRIHAGLLDLYA